MKAKKAKLCFVKINAVSSEILYFYKKLFEYFGYNVEKVRNRSCELSATNGEVDFLLSNSFNVNQEITYLVPDVGVSGINFRVKKSDVEKFIENFVKPKNIELISNCHNKETGLHEAYFYNEQKEIISVFGYPKNSKDKRNKQLGFNNLGIQAINKDSLLFYKDLLTCMGYKVVRKFAGLNGGSLREMAFCNGASEFSVFIDETGRKNTEGSMIGFLRSGVDAFFFKVKGKEEVDKFIKEFLKPRKINFRFNSPDVKEEGEYSVFFNSPEGMYIGIVSGEAKPSA